MGSGFICLYPTQPPETHNVTSVGGDSGLGVDCGASCIIGKTQVLSESRMD